MLKLIYVNYLNELFMNKSSQQYAETIVTFTGGLGAQIFSSAIYFLFKKQGRTVYADLDYFRQPGKTAIVGNKGEISHWDYELGEYGLPLESFSIKNFKRTFFKRNMPHLIKDGAVKIELAIEALRQQEVKKLFPIKHSVLEECLKVSSNNDYLCIHIRRGDYVNVSSHLVDDMDFVYLARSISTFVPAVIVISDSAVSDTVKENLSGLFKYCSFNIGGNLHVAHALIRQAKYLICSNSQFSLSAALLNNVAQQIFLPTKWFGDVDSLIQIPINDLCRFQILSRN